jgi:hypothetical protein
MIKTLFKAFIGFKLFQILLSIALISIVYKIYPQLFYFITQILSNIK